MNDYSYARDLAGGSYDIDNPARFDSGGVPKLLAAEVEQRLPGRKFTLSCTAGRATFKFEGELSPVERALLDVTVDDHKNNR